MLFVYTQGSVRAFGTLATLGFSGVSCLKALVISLNFNAVALSFAKLTTKEINFFSIMKTFKGLVI